MRNQEAVVDGEGRVGVIEVREYYSIEYYSNKRWYRVL